MRAVIEIGFTNLGSRTEGADADPIGSSGTGVFEDAIGTVVEAKVEANDSGKDDRCIYKSQPSGLIT